MRDQASERETVSAPSHGHPGGGRGARPAELSCRLHSLRRRVWTGHYRNAEAERANSACGEWARSQDNAGSARIFIGLTARRRGPDLIAFNLAEHHLVTLQERAVDFQENETEGTGNGLQSRARASGSSFAHLCRENSGRGASRPAWGYHRGPKQSPHSDEQRVTPTNAKCPVQMFGIMHNCLPVGDLTWTGSQQRLPWGSAAKPRPEDGEERARLS